MKKILLLSVITSGALLAGGTINPVEIPQVETSTEEAPVATGSFSEALKNGTFTANLRAFYFDRSFDEDNTGIPNATALTAGGIIKYESAAYNGFKFGLAHYSSTRLGSTFTREEGKGTSILGRDGEDLAFLGEAYLQYDLGNTMFKVGRQQLSTPLIQNHDLRILPTVYEAAIIRNTDIPNTMVEVGFVDRETGFTSKDNAFNEKRTGTDGIAYISLANKSIENLSLRGQYVSALTDNAATETYTYIDAKYALPVGKNTYIKAQYGGNTYAEGEDSTLVGAKIGTTLGMFDVAALYDQISDNSFKAFESGPMYSDWQQGYGNYEASTAFGGQIVVKPMAGLSLKFGYVDVAADEGNVRDDFSEFNFDGKYTINDWSKIRVRYSMKDQTDESDREDRDDFRIIYYMNF
ncbi:MAG: OprD family outer membrane porin [Campylobacterota bacterium]|nr:OprD family outer membrane porin [Campylobacterota bacterium]